jgi:hypothetical protein
MSISLVQRLRFDATRCEAAFSKGVARNIEEAADEIERLRAALQRIVTEADSDDGLSAWNGSDIAREALIGHQQRNTVPVNKPFERVPQHESDPGFGPVPPRRVVNKKDSETPDC